MYIIGGYQGKLNSIFKGLYFRVTLYGNLFTNSLLGNYLGDVWQFDFKKLQYNNLLLTGPDDFLLSRSNHTAIYFEKHNS